MPQLCGLEWSTLNRMVLCLCALSLLALPGLADNAWEAWPPRKYLLKSLVAAVPELMKSYRPETGRFGTDPWVCADQNVIYPLAAAWSIEDPDNPYYHDAELLAAIAKGGEYLVDQQDEKGMWIFRKKDKSTWGQIHMPWTFSRWIRAYSLVRDALPPESREKWEAGLKLGYGYIAGYTKGGVHNIPTHHAMGLYIAGECFENEEWKQAAKGFMAKVCAKQDPAGFWSEHYGPVVLYNFVYPDAIGIYYHFSGDEAVLETLRRAAAFHSNILWPDGSSVSTIDERTPYSERVDAGDVGFTWTPEGRGFMLKQAWTYSHGGERLMAADLATSLLLYGGAGEAIMPPADKDRATATIGDNDALIRRHKPWQWALSGYACAPIQNRWIQDRHNMLDIWHDEMGLVIGGGNTKLQPYWSTFTVGDPSLLKHEPGDENPDFIPEIDLQWTPDEATITADDESTHLGLKYGEVECAVTVKPLENGDLSLTFRAPAGKRVEAHLPLMRRSRRLTSADGEKLQLSSDEVMRTAEEIGDHFVYAGLRVSMPAGTSLLWPAKQHNPYTKDGKSSPGTDKVVLLMPFEERDEYAITVGYAKPEPFPGLAWEARDLPFIHSEGTYTKRLDGLGSQFLGSGKPGSHITFTLPGVEAGRYELIGDFVKAYSYGIVKVLVDGKQVGGTYDGYWPEVDAEGDLCSFGEVELGPGEHAIRLEIAGKSEKATAHLISVKRWLLRPLDGE